MRHDPRAPSAATHPGSREASSGESTLVHLLDRARGAPGSGLRLLDRRGRGQLVEWREIVRGASEVAGALRQMGVERGERVALVYPTCLELFHALFGAQLAGAVPVPLYPPVRLGRLDEYHAHTTAMIEAASARLILADARVRRLLGPTVEAARPSLGCRTLGEMLGIGSPIGPRAAAERTEPGDLALVQFSSGTTVAPKPVALSHRAILAQVSALNSHWPDDAATGLRHTGVSWLPLYHDMGLIGCVFPALERPSVLTLLRPEVFVARPHLWLRAISDHRATISVAPNFAYGLCVEKIRDQELEGVDLSSWRVALNGAEPVSPEVLRAFQARFAPWGFRPEALTPVYGLSEATLAVTFSELGLPFRGRRFDREALTRGEAVPSPDGREIISVGKPVPDTEIEIRPQGPAPTLGASPIGRVWVRGPSLMEGYLDRPEATAEALVDGWLDTGDLGFVHEGELFLVGRAKDIVLVHGRNHSPEEIEHALDGLGGLRTGCAVALSYLPEGAAG
ncbi:MAG: AMP-binding protein, partial [Holophagales bacterium]|nr:AMP-binding protein [Holophagales bacterium]